MDGKKDVHLDGSPIGTVSRLEVIEGPTGRRVRSEAERARIVAESLLPGAQVSEVARKHGATRWQIYDWRRRFRQRGALPSREAPDRPVLLPQHHQIDARPLQLTGQRGPIRLSSPAEAAPDAGMGKQTLLKNGVGQIARQAMPARQSRHA